uniref:Uncharacterized protein n=1 Tax=Anguilla anguilla TaxID=7936 RepID=A0A0E9XWS1_ANGAN
MGTRGSYLFCNNGTESPGVST